MSHKCIQNVDESYFVHNTCKWNFVNLHVVKYASIWLEGL